MRRKLSILIFLFAMFTFSGLSMAEEPSGTVAIDEYELAYIFNGSMGGGTLYYQGYAYNFRIGGLGIGGIGASHISASGEVFNLRDIRLFTGTYAQVGAGFAATDQGQGQLWLQNENGVKLHLYTSQQGLGLTAGASGIVINWKE